MTYIIHGATGAQGSPVVTALISAGKPVTAVTRTAEAVVPGARAVTAGYSSSVELSEAYRGADGVFVHLPAAAEEDRRVYARNIVTAVATARPARVVFSTSGFALDTPQSAVSILVDGLADSGVSHAVIAPELYLENLLMPHVIGPARDRGVLGYPLPADFAVSWASHVDIADVALALFDRPDISGIVSVGQYPAITGPELAEAFGSRLGRNVAYQAITPDEFRTSLAPLLGELPAAEVARSYEAMATLEGRSIDPELSAQKLLGITPRTAAQWLAHVDLH
ncbi:SDR family oxidoreductase [Amycolatopsis sp. NPDC059657]|uniref:SDR family oxidoreductase n=1 Tax=Amycolatopsis sp. NPDC059657 TaxID=3346899 RepID=UPI00367330C9